MTVQDLINELSKHNPTDIVSVQSRHHKFNSDYYADIDAVMAIPVFRDETCFKDARHTLADLKSSNDYYKDLVTPPVLPPTVRAVVLIGR